MRTAIVRSTLAFLLLVTAACGTPTGDPVPDQDAPETSQESHDTDAGADLGSESDTNLGSDASIASSDAGGPGDAASSSADAQASDEESSDQSSADDPAEAANEPDQPPEDSAPAPEDPAATSDEDPANPVGGSEPSAENEDDAASDPAQSAVDPPPAAEGDPTAPAAAADPNTIERAADWQPEDPSGHPLAIQGLRGLDFPGSDLVVVEELAAGSSYSRSVATYQSEGLTIRGLLTIPNGERPASGWPVIIFNHGYIPPAQYRTNQRYVAYQDAFARAGYITYKSDYRGHGSSEGESGSSRGTPDYTIDVMNALSSVARHPDADPNRIGMWGHSMGGLITLKSMVITDRIKAGVIWAGVVASYPDLYNRLGRAPRSPNASSTWQGRRSWRLDLVERFGTPEENPAAWDALSPNAFLSEISGPLQLHHGTADSSVPVEHSTRLQEQMDAAGRLSESFIYEGDDHNLAGSLQTALARSVAFFDQHVKGGG